MKEIAKYADYLVYLSVISLVLAAYGAFASQDMWLAPTQWLLVSIGLTVYGLYLKQK